MWSIYEKNKQAIHDIALLLVAILVCFLFFKYLSPIFLPFIIGWLMSLLFNPLADKLLTISVMAYLCEIGHFPAWALMIVLTREFAVTGLRLIAVQKGTVIAAGWSGKLKTATTMVGLTLMMAFSNLSVLNWVLMLMIVLTTLWSGIEYFIDNWNCLWE